MNDDTRTVCAFGRTGLVRPVGCHADAHVFPLSLAAGPRLPEPTPAQRRNGILFTVFGYVILLGTLTAAGLVPYGSGPVPFGAVFLHLWIICMTWNVVDLLVLDWLVFCTITPKSFILPGTEGCKGYKDYRFHFIGFLKGCVYMTLFALIFAGIDFAVLKLLIW
ncbi:hypothetical protein ACRQV7_00655 [Caproiciproducens sp. R2]|uniref:hypothetical protein n=1 Tax=Caproiciproducens sp. R2 TaxID=3435187 RepID=UPI00403386AD